MLKDLYTILKDNKDFEAETRAASWRKENHGCNVRRLIIAFCYSRSGQMYLVLTDKAFRDNICGWIGSVHDCYVLHSQSVKYSFSLFNETDSFLPIDTDNEQEKELMTLSNSNVVHEFSLREGNTSSQNEKMTNYFQLTLVFPNSLSY